VQNANLKPQVGSASPVKALESKLFALMSRMTNNKYQDKSNKASRLEGNDEIVVRRNALLTSLLYSMATLSRSRDPNAIIQGICDAIIRASPRIRLVWAWHGTPTTRLIEPMLYAGPAAGYAETLKIQRNYLTLRGPAFRALLAGEDEYMSVSRMSLFGPWRAAAKEHGFEVAGAFPLRVPDSSRRGILICYADDKEYFQKTGMDPFIALAKIAEASLVQADVHEKLQSQAMTDALTGLHNRRFMDLELARLWKSHQLHGTSFALLLIDIDRFKNINDTYGHGCGDEVLKKTAQILRAQLRAGDLVARWGGEEFICAISHATPADAATLAERIRAMIAIGDIEYGGHIIRWTVSIGVGCSNSDGQSLDELASAVDTALYAAKSGGRNQIFTAKLDPLSSRSANSLR
jgi:diguanylate cyclase (GGDEF)-like protein